MARKAKSDHYVFSTLSAPMDYTAYVPGGGDLPIVDSHIRIDGGANVADTKLVTPRGVVTGVSSAELDALNQNEVFKLHKANGFITISDTDEDEEVMAADMTGRDQSAPLVDQDFAEPTKETDTGAPVVNTGKQNNRRA